VVDGDIYVFGGFYDPDLHASKRVDVYDPESDTWTRRADMPIAVTHLIPALDGRMVWFAGGFEGKNPGPTTDRVFKYDVDADAWTPGPPLPEARGAGALVRLDRSLHYFGGFASDRDSTPGEHWALDLDSPGSWRALAPLPDPRGHLGAIVHEGRIYAIGGQHRHDTKPVDVDSLHAYDPDQDRWTELARLPTPRSHFEAGTFVWNGRIVIAGGRDNTSGDPAMSHVSAYDPRTNRWSELPRLPNALLGPVMQVVGRRVVLSTGSLDGWNAPQAATYVIDTEKYFD
jgi:N-acetylneuraminic acid mutarotase